MITEREEKLLWDMDNISDYLLDLFTDEEIKENIKCFLGHKNFRDSERAVSILLSLTEEEIKELKLEIYSIPDKLKFEEALLLIDRGIEFSKCSITKEYAYPLLNYKENTIKYKHLISPDTVINKQLWFICANERALDNFVEIFYDEIKDITTRTLLDSLGVNLGEDKPNFIVGKLLDKINSIGNREFKDDTIIKKLLMCIKDNNNDNIFLGKYKEIFDYFDEDYICNNIGYFSPIQLNNGGKLTEKIFEKILNNNEIMRRYEHGFGNSLIELSDEFIINNYKKMLNNKWNLYYQKNIIKAYRKYSNNKTFIDNIDLIKVYLHNPHLSEEDLEWLKNEIKDTERDTIINSIKIDQYVSDLALKRLSELGVE